MAMAVIPAAEAGVDASLSALPLVCHVDPGVLFMLLLLIICGGIRKRRRD